MSTNIFCYLLQKLYYIVKMGVVGCNRFFLSVTICYNLVEWKNLFYLVAEQKPKITHSL